LQHVKASKSRFNLKCFYNDGGNNRRREIRKTEEPMKRSLRIAIAFALASLGLCASADAKIVTFQIPGATHISPRGMNDKGQVTGTYADANRATHGFLLDPDGTLTRFDVPFTGIGKHDNFPPSTSPLGVTAAGVVIGSYYTSESGGGFVRAADGSITTFQLGAETALLGANKKGWTVGYYLDNDKRAYQPFLRDPSGAIQKFGVPGMYSAFPAVVNRSRTIAGFVVFQDGPVTCKGFYRPAHGNAKLFGHPHQAVNVAGINDAGTIVGSFEDTYSVAFIMTSDGSLKTFSAPYSYHTYASGINNAGTIVGNTSSGNGISRGFIRTADGTLTPFSIEGTWSTEILAINDKGAIAGDATYKDLTPIGFAGKP